MITRLCSYSLILGFLFAPLASPAPSAALQGLLQQIFVERAFEGKRPPQFEWVDDGAGYTVLEPSNNAGGGEDIVRYTTASNERKVLVEAKDLIPPGQGKALKVDGYEFSKDKKRLLMFTNSKPVWRQHTRGDYWLFDMEAKKLAKLGGEGEPSTMQFAKFSPDAAAVAFVRANNLFVENLDSRKIRQLTRDGSHTIVNGTSDWVYEEELSLRDGFRWSPDGRRIAFWHFDASGLGEYPLINYTDSIYPAIKLIPYPKAGTTNSAVSVGVVDVRRGKTKWMDVPGDPRQNYLARMEWAGNSNELAIEQLNRLQNTADLLIADASNGRTKRIFRDQSTTWVDENELRLVGGSFLWLSERDGWRHIYLVPRDQGEAKLLTPGQYDVMSVAGVAEKQGAVFFMASPGDATQSYLYRASLSGGEPVRVTPEGANGFHTYRVSSGGEWAFHGVSGFDRPWRYELVKLADARPAHVFVDDSVQIEKVRTLLENKSEFFRVDIGDGVSLDGWMIRPKDFNAAKKYPVLVHIYGEPAGQTVVDRWGGDTALFHRALAQDGYVVVSFDNRGTPAPKGRDWRKIVYGSVGPLAAREQTAAIKRLCEERTYLDANRIAVWGWSGGGTNTLNLMFRSAETYKLGMAVAPVPDQRLYDTIYQERYMGLPQDNPEGYRRGSAINFASRLKGQLLLVHGTGDDNVHFQGSQMLINKLVQNGKQFTFMEYPNRTHAINEGEGTSIHLFTLLADYLEGRL
jgi:dipeptidyl-peptidase-4